MATRKTPGGRRAGKGAPDQQPANEPVKQPGKQPRKAPAQKGKAKPQAARKVPAKKAAKAPARGKGANPLKDGTPAPMPPVEKKETASVLKRLVGRPTVYRDEFVDMILVFFRIDIERQVEVTKPGPDGKPMSVTEIVLNRFPTLERFADSIGVTRQTLHDWSVSTEKDGKTLKHPEFSYAYARARDLQAALLQEGGIGGQYESRVATLALKNIAGWREQVEQQVTTTLTTATTDELNAVYAEGIERSRRARAEAEARRQAELQLGEQSGQGE
jgi:hypothetical protein